MLEKITPRFYPATTGTPTPETLWAEIAPKIFLTHRIRVSTDQGKTYPRRTETGYTPTLPEAPATFRIYTPEGLTHCIALDFDAQGVPQRAVEQAQHCQQLLESFGARTFTDTSISGGVHLYMPLATALPFAEAKTLTLALAQMYSHLDAAPMCGLTDGQIRVPGSAHKKGGHQLLCGSLEQAHRALTDRTSTSSINALTAHLKTVHPHIFELNANPYTGDLISQAEALQPSRHRPLPFFPEFESMAATGKYDKSRYGSDSEARLGFARAAVRAGHSFASFVTALESKAWAGAAKFWKKYSPSHYRKSLARDWVKAHQKLPSQVKEGNRVHNCNTRGKLTQPPIGTAKENTGAIYDQIHAWYWALLSCEKQRWSSRESLANRIVLRALGAMCQRTGSLQVAAGVRSLGLAAFLDGSTVSRVLGRLCREKNPLIRLVQVGRGLEANLYELVLPAGYSAPVPGWVPRLIPSVHEVFYSMPVGASLVFEQVTVAGVSSFDIAASAGVSTRLAQHVLGLLAGLGLVVRCGGLWVTVAGVSMSSAAQSNGGRQLFLEQLYKVRVQRAAWVRWLTSRTSYAQVEVFAPGQLDQLVGQGALHPVSDDGSLVWWDDVFEWVPREVWEAESPVLVDPLMGSALV